MEKAGAEDMETDVERKGLGTPATSIVMKNQMEQRFQENSINSTKSRKKC